MSNEGSSVRDEPLQFDRVEPAGADGTVVCRGCHRPIVDGYHVINGASVCAGCREAVVRQLQGPLGARRFLRAAGLGLAAAVAGSLLWYGVGAVTGYEVGFVAIVVGL